MDIGLDMNIRIPHGENQYVEFKSESVKPVELAEKTSDRQVARIHIPSGKDKPYYTSRHKCFVRYLFR